ncbi:unnamed protein product [Candidula unifasciata]|uniref:Solute carrier family 40 member n=1 Tax=Candidula unifasciata TaxID=100452 RepID=A0A8S3YHN1_9EUPU|nr:unnamed protein product [Candidula unifasciata]
MPCIVSCKQWLTGTNFFVYWSHFLSAWGDRMWSFGVGLFLINISPDSLQLTAAYGLSMGLSVLLFGALVGDIVDATPRLKAAQTALVLQNLFVVACAVVVYLFLVFRSEILSFGDWTMYVTYTVIILLSVLSKLTSMARQIAVEKDWIVEICGTDFDKLATMTATLRRIDLTTQVLAPIATGLIMSFAGVHFGALFIGGWNLCSVVVEYYFLWKVYNTVPALKKKKDLKKSQVSAVAEDVVDDNEELPALTAEDNTEALDAADDTQGAHKEDNSNTLDGTKSKLRTTTLDIMEHLSNVNERSGDPEQIQSVEEKTVKRQKCRCSRMFNSFERLYRGWPVYASYNVLHAGIALACLYMTVLGFDSVTVGYAKMQGVTEGMVGLAMGIAALFGIFGTFMYPVMRRRLGLTRTGIFGFSLEIMCLILCVVSVWMPGSRFNLSHALGHDPGLSANSNCTQDPTELKNSNQSYNATSDVNVTLDCYEATIQQESYLSVALLLTGIAMARFGLWIADLTVTQLFMERVKESERGKVNGVQSALNQLMDMCKFLMVVLAPYDYQFGLLVLISFTFICIGWLFYALFLHKDRGHFFHFEKCLIGCGKVPN